MTRLHRAAASVVALALTLTACGSAEKKEAATLQDQIQVSGDFAATPTIEIDAPVKVPESTSWSEETGRGEKVSTSATTILQLVLVNGRTGETAFSTYDKGQRPIEAVLGDQIFPSLVRALTGKSAQSRVVVASTSDETYGDKGAPQIGIRAGDPVVMVADILSTDPASVLDGPTGATLTAPLTAPVVREKDGVPIGFDFAKAPKPKKLVVIPLREGTGPAVESPDRIAADYVGQVWGAKQPFQEIFSKEPATFSIGLSGVIEGWDTALADKREGARVMIIIPPKLAYDATPQPNIPANSTLVFIVDVLGVG